MSSGESVLSFDLCQECSHNVTQILSSNRTTLVTALYDIGRDQQGRSMDEYLQCSFIIFTSPSLAKHIRKMRLSALSSQTMIIESEHIPLEEFGSLIETRIFPKFRPYMRHPKDITNVNKLYAIINHAKMIWLTHAIALNPFFTETFFWIDAGSSRFIPTEFYSRAFPPSLTKIRMLASCCRYK